MAESKIYISGKISALPINEAINNFNNAEEYLKQKYFYIGAQIVNPFKLDHSKAEELKRRQLDPAVPDNDGYRDWETDRKSARLNSSHSAKSRMPSSA